MNFTNLLESSLFYYSMAFNFAKRQESGRNLSVLQATPINRTILGLVNNKINIPTFDESQNNQPFTEETKELDIEDLKNEQEGRGILDIAKAAFTMGKSGLDIGSKLAVGSAIASSLASSELASKIKNKAGEKLTSNTKWRPGFVGEKHLILPTKEGITSANFCGPGTNLQKRLARGDVGVSQVDDACKVHDILYTAATSKADIRLADDRLIRDIDKSDAGIVQKNILKAGIKAKTLGEDVGVFGPETFTSIPSLEGSGILNNRGLFNNSGRDVGSVFHRSPARSTLPDAQRFGKNGIVSPDLISTDNINRLNRRLNTEPIGVRKRINPSIKNENQGAGIVKDTAKTIVSAAKMLDKAAVKQIKKVKRAGRKIKLEKLAGIAAEAVVKKILKDKGKRGKGPAFHSQQS